MSFKKFSLAIFLVLFGYTVFSQQTSRLAQNPVWLHPADSLQQMRLRYTVAGLSIGYGATLLGLSELWYKGYPRSSFHFLDDAREWQQVDKAGHTVTAYLEARYFSQMFRWTGMPQRNAALWGGFVAFMAQNTIEVFDGFSAHWGASPSDVVANLLGAAAMTSQELLWQEQRILLKVMPHFVSYPEAELQQRADDLYGKTALQRFIKDYNAINVWLSINPASFFPQQKKARWLNVAIGYGAGGMFGGYKNEWYDRDGVYHNREDVVRYRKFFLSLDVDFHRIPTRSPYLRMLFDVLNIVKVPAPAIEWNTKGQILFHPLL